VADEGISKALDGRMTAREDTAGRAEFAGAPELLPSRTKRRADAKSRGCDACKNAKKGLDNVLLVIVP